MPTWRAAGPLASCCSFRERCDPYKDAVLPTPPDDLIAELASRYIQLFEAITGTEFVPDMRPLEATVMEALAG